MRKGIRFHSKSSDKVLSKLSKDLGFDMNEVLALAAEYKGPHTSECYSFGELENVACTDAADIDPEVQKHFDSCENCRETVNRIKSLRAV